MSILRGVFLLLSVAVLLREGSCNSPLDFFIDLKNRIFSYGNSTESTEEAAIQCSGLEGGACVLHNTTVDDLLDENQNLQNTEKNGFDENMNLSNNLLDAKLFEGNNTQYYDEQDWNITASNNTENYRNEFESEQNITEFNGEEFNINNEKRNIESQETRFKRQIKNVQINIKLTSPGISTPKPLILGTRFFTGEKDKLPVNGENDQTSNSTGASQGPLKTSGSNQNGSLATNLLQAAAENKMADLGIGDNTTKESIGDIGGETNTTLDGFDDFTGLSSNVTVSELSNSENTKEGRMKTESNPVNCTNFSSVEVGSADSQNVSTAHGVISVEADQGNSDEKSNKMTDPFINIQNNVTKIKGVLDNSTGIIEEIVHSIAPTIYTLINKTTDSEKSVIEDDKRNSDGNSTQMKNSLNTIQTNITKLKDVLDNSTQIIAKIVQDIAPAIYTMINETTDNEKNDMNLTTLQNMNMTEKNNNFLEGMLSHFNKSESEGMSEPNATVSLTNTTDNGNRNTTTDTDKENSNISNFTASHFPLLNGMEFVNRFTDNVQINSTTSENKTKNIKREKRSINFTILSEDDEDFSAATYPDASMSPATELPSDAILYSTETSSWIGQEEIKIVGPVCIRQHEECTNSTDCCEDFECIGGDDSNSTSYCDLRHVNLTVSNTDKPQTMYQPSATESNSK